MASSSSSSASRSSDFYYSDLVTLMVEGTLYRLPREPFLQDSDSAFADMFSLPLCGKDAEGICDGNPIKLDGIKRVDWERFLKLLFPKTLQKDLKKLTKEDWISILMLSDLWNFGTIRHLAIESMTTLNLHERILSDREMILLAKVYNIPSWIMPAYVGLCTRQASLTLEDGGAVGMKAAFTLSNIREKLAVHYGASLYSSPVGLKRVAEAMVKDAFKNNLSCDPSPALIQLVRSGALLDSTVPAAQDASSSKEKCIEEWRDRPRVPFRGGHRGIQPDDPHQSPIPRPRLRSGVTQLIPSKRRRVFDSSYARDLEMSFPSFISDDE